MSSLDKPLFNGQVKEVEPEKIIRVKRSWKIRDKGRPWNTNQKSGKWRREETLQDKGGQILSTWALE